MRILQVNKYFYRKGGAETYLFDLLDLLAGAGHEVVPFAMRHPENRASEFDRFFVDEVDYDVPAPWYRRARQAARMVYSVQAASRMRSLVDAHRPDIAHVHNIYHQISPSILRVLARRSIPVVMTLHDYKLACPNYKLRTQGEICERCLSGKYYRAVKYRCIRGSLLGSAVCATELFLHRASGIYEDNVTTFLAPSNAMKSKVVASGIPDAKVEVLPNFVHVDRFTPSYEPSGYVVYFGRLSEEKGLLTLLESMRRVTGCRLVVAGDGPLRETLHRFVAGNGLHNVELVGRRTGAELERLVRDARATVLPSEWYENCPISVLESCAWGTPVIGARIGGIPELIEDGRTGLLFEPFSVEDLAAKIELVCGDDDLPREMGRNARLKAQREFDVTTHLERLVDVYDRALA